MTPSASSNEPPRDVTVTGSDRVMVGNHNWMVNIFSGAVRLVRGDAAPDRAAAEMHGKLAESAEAEWNALTEWGDMRVPWTASSSPDRLGTVGELGAHVAAGGHLIIQGDSQSGKTTLAVRLINVLGDRAGARPVLFRLQSWDDGSLGQWMAKVLRDEYGLQDEAYKVALEGLRDREIIPVFDGFDELTVDVGRAARELRLFTQGRPAVLTGIRRDAHVWNFETALSDSAIISLSPVADAEVRDYMRQRVPASAREQWEQVVATMTSASAEPVRAALSSPFNAWLAKTILVGSGDAARTAAELCRSQTQAEVEEYLLENVVEAVFDRRAMLIKNRDDATRNFDAVKAKRWLGFLARRSTDQAVAFWHLRNYAPLFRLAGVAAAALGLSAGLISGAAPAPFALFLLAGVTFGFGFSRGYSVGRWKGPDDPTRLGYILARDEPLPLVQRRSAIAKDGDLPAHGRKLLMGLALVAVSYAATAAVWWPARGSIDWRLGYSNGQLLAAFVASTVVARIVGHIAGRCAAFILSRSHRLDASRGARTTHPLKVIHNDRKSGILMVSLSAGVLLAGYLLFWWIFSPPSAPLGLLGVLR